MCGYAEERVADMRLSQRSLPTHTHTCALNTHVYIRSALTEHLKPAQTCVAVIRSPEGFVHNTGDFSRVQLNVAGARSMVI